MSHLAVNCLEREGSLAIEFGELSLPRIDELIDELRTRRQQLLEARAAEIRERILALLKAEGFDLEWLFGKQQPVRRTRRPAVQKYRNPADDAQTWSGRGKRPLWFSAALASGKKIEDLLI